MIKKYHMTSNQLIEVFIVDKNMDHSRLFYLFYFFHLLILDFLNANNTFIDLI